MPRALAGSLLISLLLVPVGRAADLKEDLLTAARKGDAAAVKALLAKGADVNAKTEYGVTPLALAADKGHVEVVKVLLQHKAKVNTKDTFYQFTPVSWAYMRNNTAIVGLLVEAGAEGAESLLSGAASDGQTNMVRALLDKKKFKPDTLSKALAAAPANKKEIADLLTKAGAKLPEKTKSAVDRAALAPYVGTYKGEQGVDIQLVAEDGKLIGSAQGKTVLTLIASDKGSFKVADSDELTIAFARDGDKVSSFTLKRDKNEAVYKRVEKAAANDDPKPVAVEDQPGVVKAACNWPSFRGANATGVADGQYPPLRWDAEKGTNILWKTPIPGLGHSCPVIWGERLFVTTAISGDPKATFKPGLYGDVDSVDDRSVHTWNVYCLDRKRGKVLWDQVAYKGVPRVKRHMKGTHANPTPAADASHVVACFGSEGLYCYNHDGKLLWRRDLGTLDSGWFYDADYQWGFGSSPVIYRDLVLVQCDVGKGSFLAAYRLADGEEAWRTPREEIPSWGTPTIVEGPKRTELVTNATKFARGYDPLTGKELWRLGRHAEITVPTPFYGQDLIFITSGYRPVQPIYAIRPGATGDISLPKGKTSNDSIAWSTEKNGPYMPTPIVYGEYLYVCSNNGIVTCYEAKTGKQVYKQRLGGRGGYTASPVAADGKLYFTSEEDGVRVVGAGPKFQLLAANPLGDPCMSTPAISDGMLFIRTQHYMLGIGRK
jgi:outer membrane protein assembly factor BamB